MFKMMFDQVLIAMITVCSISDKNRMHKHEHVSNVNCFGRTRFPCLLHVTESLGRGITTTNVCLQRCDNQTEAAVNIKTSNDKR